MSKTFTYQKITGHYYCQYSDDWEEDYDEFDYEVLDTDLLPEIVDLVFEDNFFGEGQAYENAEIRKTIKKCLNNLIKDNDLVGHFADIYEEQLKEIFQDEALDWYKD